MLKSDPSVPVHPSRPRWALTAIVTAAALGGSLLIASPASADAGTVVSGTVHDGDTNIADVEVEVLVYDDATKNWTPYDSDDTDSDGNWSVAVPDDGKYATYYELSSVSTTVAKFSTSQAWDGTVAPADFPSVQFTVTDGVASSSTFDESLIHNAGVIRTTVYNGDSDPKEVFNAGNGDDANLYPGLGYVDGAGVDPLSGISSPSSTLDNDGLLEQVRVPAATYYQGYIGGSPSGGSYSQEPISGVNVTAGAVTDLGKTYLYGSSVEVSGYPFISGEAKVGSLLTANVPSQDGVTFTYQWYADYVRPIIGATSQTFVPTASELGSQLAVVIYAHADGLATETLPPFTFTKQVKPGDANAGTVAITGAVKYGQTVSASVSTALAGANDFQWYLNGNPIAGADGSSYAIRSTDVGSALSVSVKSVVAGHTDAVIPSASVVVAPDDANTGSIAISGSASYGKTVKASVARSLAGTTSSYRWFRNGVLVGGVDGSSYTIGKADLGTTLTVSVTASAQGHADSVLVSAPVAIAKDAAAFKATSAKATSTKKQLKVSVSVKPGKTKISATSKVKIFYTSTKFKTVTVKNGKSTSVKLPKLAKGKHTVKVVYLGNASYAAKTVTLKVKVSK